MYTSLQNSELVYGLFTSLLREKFGHIEAIDLRELKAKIDNCEVIVTYPNTKLKHLIENYLCATSYPLEITPFLSYAIYISAKCIFEMMEQFLDDDNAREIVLDQLRAMAGDNTTVINRQCRFFLDNSGFSPDEYIFVRVKNATKDIKDILAKGALQNSVYIAQICECDLQMQYYHAPMYFLVTANLMLRHKIGNYQYFSDHSFY